jgi:hypothetical protein
MIVFIRKSEKNYQYWHYFALSSSRVGNANRKILITESTNYVAISPYLPTSSFPVKEGGLLVIGNDQYWYYSPLSDKK